MAYNALNNLIDAYIYANGVQAITGQILNGVLKQMVSQLGSGYHLMGVAGPETVPASNDYAMAYFAATAGEYIDFGGITLAAGEVAVLLTSGNGSWSKQTIYTVPTDTADLENTAGFITNAVTNLVNYYTKTEVDDTLANYPTLSALATALADYYTKTEIDGQMGDVDTALADRYTKSETDTKLGDYYKKTETYDKDEVDSIVAALSRQEYIVAWDGLAAPDVSAIPAGVTVTYSGTPYTGTLAASASTVNKIYMVWNGVAYDMYGTSQDGGYSWVPMGTTSVDLSQYATKAELSQLQQKLIKYNDTEISVNDVIDGAYPKNDLSGLSFGNVGKSTSRFAIQTGKTYRISLSGTLKFVCSNSQGNSWGGGMDTTDEAVFTNSDGWYYLCVGQTDPARAKVYIREVEDVIPELEAEIAGNAEQIENTNGNIGDIHCRPISFVQNKSIFGLRYPPVDIDNPMTDNPGARCAFVPIAPGEEVTINATGGGTARTWGFVDANGGVILNSGYQTYEFKDYKVIAPALSAYLVINDTNTGGNCQIGESVKNLIDNLQESTFTDGVKITSWAGIDEKNAKYIAADGREYQSDYRWTSDYIMVKPGSTISCQNMNLNIGGATCFGIACYDSNKVFIPGKGISGNTAQISDSFVVEDGIAYVKVSDAKDSTSTFDIQKWQPISEAVEETITSIELLKSKIASFNKNGVSLLEGKTIALFGDSIFEIAGSASGARKRISDYLAEYTGATVLNFGFGGSSICNTHTTSPNYAKFDLVNLLPAVISGDLSEQETAAAAISQDWVDIVQALENFSFSDCDIVVLGYGTNDYTNGSTINGMQQQLAVSLQMIFEAKPKIHIVLDLPHYRVWNNPDDFVDDAYTHLNSYGKTLGEYCDAIEETGEQFGVVSNPNLYNSGWNRYNMNEYFFHLDGAHFLSNACEICAGRLFDTLNRQGWK